MSRQCPGGGGAATPWGSFWPDTVPHLPMPCYIECQGRGLLWFTCGAISLKVLAWACSWAWPWPEPTLTAARLAELERLLQFLGRAGIG